MRPIVAAVLVVIATALLPAQEQAPNRREFTITARDHRFIPDQLEVSQDDIVHITLTSEGQAYAFAIDAYRIVKRAAEGQRITFEFSADQAGTFPFYCSLTSDPECRAMRGALTVKAK